MTTSTTAVEPRTTLSQIIAVRPTLATDTKHQMEKYYHLLQQKTVLSGLTRTYAPGNDEGFRYPNEATDVAVKTGDIVKAIASDLTRLFDVTAAMDWTNQYARADVVIWNDDVPFVLLSDVPVTYLMFLEKQLVELQAVVRRLPLLDPAEQWEYDPNSDVYKSAAVGTVKTRKVRRNHVLAAATERHPAQVESYTEDEPVGTWTTVKTSGALPAAKVNKMLARIKRLSEAVKMARQSANITEIMDPKPGAKVLKYVFDVADE